ncbi:uncharacterized protein LOC134669833 [Cydia fagiglandana]|uniref:uncharacterized protein LOC134669833 n=1 Tax=Cydia fagiglandana TaxID=1458189 RepID=UPI002FEE6254
MYIYILTTLLFVLRNVSLVRTNCYGDLTITVLDANNAAGLYFYLPVGKPLEILCSGPGPLEISLYGESLPIDTINSTTVRFKQEKPEKQASVYVCSNSDIKCALRLVIDNPPEIKDFKCISKNLEVLNCSWTNNNVLISNVSLCYKVNNHKTIPCRVNRNRDMDYCTWDTQSSPRYRQQEENILFLMDACNKFGCTHNMYNIDHIKILKPDPPLNLKVLNKTTNNAVLEWTISNNMIDFLQDGLEHKIEYWFYGAQFRQVDSTLPLKQRKYRFELSLPCANQYYEVRISIRPIRASKTGMWSEPSSICFSTDAEIKGDIMIDPACDTVTETPEVMIYFVRKLRQRVNKELSKFKEEIRQLKLRAVSIYK